MVAIYFYTSHSFDEGNAVPVIYHRKYKPDEIALSEEVIVDTLPLKSPVNLQRLY